MHMSLEFLFSLIFYFTFTEKTFLAPAQSDFFNYKFFFIENLHLIETQYQPIAFILCTFHWFVYKKI